MSSGGGVSAPTTVSSRLPAASHSSRPSIGRLETDACGPLHARSMSECPFIPIRMAP